jgi:hypothetical protein
VKPFPQRFTYWVGMRCVIKTYRDYPAVEWVVLRTRGCDTSILANILPLDVLFLGSSGARSPCRGGLPAR